MIENFSQLIEEAASGRESALELLFTYFKEKSFTADEELQLHIYLKKTVSEQAPAIYLRGLLYEYGYGVKKNPDMAFILMREAVSKGYGLATYVIGRYYAEGVGVEVDYANAFQWLKAAAESPHYLPQAMFDLGEMYEMGRGMDKDLERAQEWYEKAAQKGHYAAKAKIEAK